MENIISERYLAFSRGKKMRKNGEISPPKPANEEDIQSLEFWTWCGYRVQLADEFFKIKRAAELCGAEVPELKE